jgi:hypothetical protein
MHVEERQVMAAADDEDLLLESFLVVPPHTPYETANVALGNGASPKPPRGVLWTSNNRIKT